MKEWKTTTRHYEVAKRNNRRYISVAWDYFDRFYGLIASMNALRLLLKLCNLAMRDERKLKIQ